MSNKFTFSYANVNSITTSSDLGSRLDHIRDLLVVPNKCDMFACTETKLDPSIESSNISIPSYILTRKDRNRHGGGVAFYVRDTIHFVRKFEFETPLIEIIWIELSLVDNIKLLAGVCYRPPNQKSDVFDLFMSNLELSFERIFESNGNYSSIILMGDFNDPCTSWEGDHSLSQLRNNLLLLTKSYNFNQLILEPTRGENILDLLFTSVPDKITMVQVLDPIHDLDHCPFLAQLNIGTKQLLTASKISRHIFHYNNGDFVKLNSLISEVPWHSILSSDTDDNQYTFNKLVGEMCCECIPNYHVKIYPNSKPGMTLKIKNLFKKANKLHKRAQYTKRNIDIEKHKSARRIAKSEWKKSQFNFYLNLNLKLMDKETSTKAWWKLNKIEMGISKRVAIPSLVQNGTILTDDEDKCEVLNNFLADQCRLNVPDHATFFINNEKSKLVSPPITLDNIIVLVNDVLSITKSLNINKSSGSDLVGNTVLNKCSESLALPLSILFNNSLQNSHFPTAWKRADIYPIFKKDDPQNCANYRPISLLSPTSKLLERLVYNKLYEFCQKNKLLTPRNSGFKRLDSTVSQLIHITNLIYKGLDDGKKIAAVFLDISKAFDSVWHEGLLFKLEKIGVKGKLLQWFYSYLFGRSQRVVLNGKCSKYLKITSGVPQGSILGPLLFLIFINDIVENIESYIFLFADDTSMINISDSWNIVNETLNSDLLLLNNWSSKWLVDFNANKSVYMIISNSAFAAANNTVKLKLNDTPLSLVDTHKHLGLVFNSSLTWSDHVNFTCKRVSKRLGILYKFKNSLNRNILVKLYCSWIRPVIEYCSICYDNISVKDNLKLEKLQRRAAIICTGAQSRTDTLKLLAEVGWEKLCDRRRSAKLILMYKILNRLTPDYLHDDFINTQPANPRRAGRLTIPFCRLTKFRSSFFPSTVKIWNQLPNEIKIEATSIGSFKSRLVGESRGVGLVTIFNSMHGFYAKNLTQLRLGLSTLRGHLFSHNIIENPICPLCLDAFESNLHFFMECTALATHRDSLLTNLKVIVPNFTKYSKTEIVNLCLSGSGELSHDLNCSILKLAINFMKLSDRFTFEYLNLQS